MIKRVLKILGLTLIVIIVGLLVFGLILNKPLPKGEQGTEADALAQKMLTALHYENYNNTRFLEWSFRNGTHQYKWDKFNNTVKVQWDNTSVTLNLSNPKSSTTSPSDGENASQIKKAITKFNNDSFWLVAPYKVFDKGTTRSIVILEDGTKALLVTYTSGGSNPGDSYLWKLNSNGFPNAYQMWVGILPIGGVEATWDDWLLTENGVYLPKSHKFGPITLDMGNVKTYN